MQNFFSDLIERVFTHWKSSAQALVLVFVGFLSDYGITLSEANTQKLTAWFLLAVVAFQRLFAKDEKPTDDNTVPPSVINRLLTPLVLFMLLPLAFSACGKDKTTTHKLAIYTANADAALIALTDATTRLNQAGRVSNDAAKSVYVLNLRVALAVDTIRERSKTGFDKRATLAVLRGVIEDIRKAEALGVVGLTPEQSERFRQITFFALFTVNSIEAVIAATKEPDVPVSEVKNVLATKGIRGVSNTDQTVWTDLVLILQQAITRSLAQSRMSAEDAFAEGVTLSQQLKADLQAKIGN